MENVMDANQKEVTPNIMASVPNLFLLVIYPSMSFVLSGSQNKICLGVGEPFFFSSDTVIMRHFIKLDALAAY